MLDLTECHSLSSTYIVFWKSVELSYSLYYVIKCWR